MVAFLNELRGALPKTTASRAASRCSDAAARLSASSKPVTEAMQTEGTGVVGLVLLEHVEAVDRPDKVTGLGLEHAPALHFVTRFVQC